MDGFLFAIVRLTKPCADGKKKLKEVIANAAIRIAAK